MSYEQLSLEERFVIYPLRMSQIGVREIARTLRHALPQFCPTLSCAVLQNGAFATNDAPITA